MKKKTKKLYLTAETLRNLSAVTAGEEPEPVSGSCAGSCHMSCHESCTCQV